MWEWEVVNSGQFWLVGEGRRGMRRTCEPEQSVMYLQWRELSASAGVGTYSILPHQVDDFRGSKWS